MAEQTRYQSRRHVVTVGLDRFFFAFAGVAAVWLAYLLLRETFEWSWHAIALFIVFWALVAYLVLPRLHRMLTYFYLPDYFIGRARTSDGLLGDPVNIALLGDEPQLHAVMERAGWVRADDVTLASSVKIIRTTLARRAYPEAPVSPLTLFGRQQDFAYQQEVDGNPAQRHHVRFWRCPHGWRLPGGFAVDWLAAGTYDKRVGLSLFTLQVTHKIAPDVDAERDHVVATLQHAVPDVSVDVVEDYSSGYHARNGGGDRIESDGDMPFVDLRSVRPPATSLHQTVRTDPRPRPSPTVFGAAVAVLRGFVHLLTAVVLLLSPDDVDSVTTQPVLVDHPGTAGGVMLVAAILDIALGAATYRGSDVARIVLMAVSAVGVVTALVVEAQGGPRPTFATGLATVTLSILVLLALSSTRSRVYAENWKASAPRNVIPPEGRSPREV